MNRWERNETNHIWRRLIQEYNIDSWFDAASLDMVFFNKDNKLTCKMYISEFTNSLDKVYYLEDGIKALVEDFILPKMLAKTGCYQPNKDTSGKPPVDSESGIPDKDEEKNKIVIEIHSSSNIQMQPHEISIGRTRDVSRNECIDWLCEAIKMLNKEQNS